MHGVTSPVLPAAHVARLRLPLATTLEGRIVAAPERRPHRTVLLLEAAAVGRGAARRPVCGLVRLALRHPARRWRYGERLRVETRLRAPRNFEFRLTPPETLHRPTRHTIFTDDAAAIGAVEWGGMRWFGSSVVARCRSVGRRNTRPSVPREQVPVKLRDLRHARGGRRLRQ